MRTTVALGAALIIGAVVLSALGDGRPDPLDFQQCSIVNLIATPEKYDGKLVAVAGYCRIVYEDHSLYLSREHAEMIIFGNSVWLSFDTKEFDDDAIQSFNNKYVMVFGRFNAKNKSHMGASAGAVEGIWKVVGLKHK